MNYNRLANSFWQQQPQLFQISAFLLEQHFNAIRAHLKLLVAEAVRKAWGMIEVIKAERTTSDTNDASKSFKQNINNEIGRIQATKSEETIVFLENFTNNAFLHSVERMISLHPAHERVLALAIQLTKEKAMAQIESHQTFMAEYLSRKLSEVVNASTSHHSRTLLQSSSPIKQDTSVADTDSESTLFNSSTQRQEVPVASNTATATCTVFHEIHLKINFISEKRQCVLQSLFSIFQICSMKVTSINDLTYMWKTSISPSSWSIRFQMLPLEGDTTSNINTVDIVALKNDVCGVLLHIRNLVLSVAVVVASTLANNIKNSMNDNEIPVVPAIQNHHEPLAASISESNAKNNSQSSSRTAWGADARTRLGLAASNQASTLRNDMGNRFYSEGLTVIEVTSLLHNILSLLMAVLHTIGGLVATNILRNEAEDLRVLIAMELSKTFTLSSCSMIYLDAFLSGLLSTTLTSKYQDQVFYFSDLITTSYSLKLISVGALCRSILRSCKPSSIAYFGSCGGLIGLDRILKSNLLAFTKRLLIIVISNEKCVTDVNNELNDICLDIESDDTNDWVSDPALRSSIKKHLNEDLAELILYLSRLEAIT